MSANRSRMVEEFSQLQSKGLLEGFFEDIGKGKSLEDICKVYKWPYVATLRHIRDDPYWSKEFAAAQEARAQRALDKAGKAVDGAGLKTLDLHRFKLDGNLKLAEKYDPDRFRRKTEQTVKLEVDNGLVGDAIALLAKVRQTSLPREKVLNALDAPILPQEAQQEVVRSGGGEGGEDSERDPSEDRR